MPINELRAIDTFILIAELGSLRKAAQAQGTTAQAASKALAQLEQQLGVRLVHRTTRQLTLTPAGQQFLQAAQPAVRSLQHAMQAVQQAQDDMAGPLCIVGPASTLRPVIAPLLAEFGQRHPQVQPDVQLDDRLGNWVQDRMDIGFRLSGSPPEGTIARLLYPTQFIICATPAYLARHGAPTSLQALAAHRCAAFRGHQSGRVLPWHVGVNGQVVDHPVTPAFCTNDEVLELQMVLSGQVIGQLAGVTAVAHIRAGRLVPVLPQHVAEQGGLSLYYGSRAQPARVRAFIDLVVQRLAGSTAYVLTAEELAAATGIAEK